MYFNHVSRRFFLQGIGGAALAVPFLGSLVPKAEAAENNGLLKNIIFLKHSHGYAYSNIAAPTNLSFSDLGQGMRKAPLPDTFANFGSSYAKANLNDLKDQICHITGLDCTLQSRDHGNNFFINGNPLNNLFRSVDQVIAKHIYGSQTPVINSMTTGNCAFSGEGPGYDDNGTIRKPATYPYPVDTFRALFQEMTGASSANQAFRDRFAIDRVSSDLKALLSSGRLSQMDKGNLTNYIDLISDFEKRLKTKRAIHCIQPSAPTAHPNVLYAPEISMADQSNYVAAGIACGITRVAVMYIYDGELAITNTAMATINSVYPSMAHNDHGAVWHSINNGPHGSDGLPVPGAIAMEAASTIDSYFLNCAATLARLLKGYADESTGLTLLDKSAVVHGREFGASKLNDDPHMLRDIHLMLIGGGQAINTGRHFDYKTSTPAVGPYDGRPYLGLPYNDFLIGMMLAMGLKPADWELNGQAGFGSYDTSQPYLFRDKRSAPPGLLRV